MRKPGIASSLSSVPPVWPRPAARELRHRGPAGGHERAQRQRDLVAHPARRVLVNRRQRGRTRGRGASRSGSSRRSRWPARGASCPRKTIAISSAEACSSAHRAARCRRSRNQRICASLSSRPSRLARMTSTARVAHRPARARTSSGPNAPGSRSPRRHGSVRRRRRSRSGPAVLVQQLAAAAAGRQRPPVAGHDRHGHQAPAARRRQVGHQPALGAERQRRSWRSRRCSRAPGGRRPVSAARPHQHARVGRVGAPVMATRLPPQEGPVDAHARQRQVGDGGRRLADAGRPGPGAGATPPARRARAPRSRGRARGPPRPRAPAPGRCPSAPSCRPCRRRPARRPCALSTRA